MITYQPASQFDFDALVFRIETEKLKFEIGRKPASCEGRVGVPFQGVTVSRMLRTCGVFVHQPIIDLGVRLLRPSFFRALAV